MSEAPVATAPDAAPGGDAAVAEVVVFGRGQTRQVQSVSHADILSAAPGTSAIKVISKLPSVNFQAADPFGAYEWAERISIRGFAQNQLGYTLDDVPLGDMSYANDNGLHISRAISSENIGRTELSQGTGGLDTASTSNIGGTLRFYSIDPSHAFTATAAATYGSEDTVRGLARIETGDLPGGGRGYASYTYLGADKWKGDGDQVAHQFNSKYIQPIGDKATLTGFFNFSERHEHDYQDLSLSLINRLGYKVDNISNDYATAQQIARVGANTGYTGVPQRYPGAGMTYPAPYETADDVYYDAAGNRRDLLGGLRLDYALTDTLKFKATAYAHHNQGMGTWDTPYQATLAADGSVVSPLSLRTTEYHIQREGVVSSLTWTLGAHTIEGSFWFENNDFDQARRFYGLGATTPGRQAAEFQSDPFFTQWQYAFNTKTYVASLQDTWQVFEPLKVNFGFKSVNVDNQARTINAASESLDINGKISTDENFLPQIGAVYRLDSHNELFADYAQNVRAFVSSHTDGPFSTTQAGFDAIKGGLKPETTDTAEGGYRVHFANVEGVLAGYYAKFHDRLLATTVGAGIIGNPAALANVGGVTSKGFEAAGTYRFAPSWSLFASYSYNESAYDDDVTDGTGALVVATKGKDTVDTPRNLTKGSITYDDGRLFGGLSVYYVDKRYYTYSNDASVPDYGTMDLDVGYRVKSANRLLNGLEVQVNVTNLTDEKYISTIGTNGFVNNDPTGAFQTLMVGSPREAFVTLRKSF